ncbi:MAG: hypothetical protein HYV66_02515 [Candidatus Sungbacteria bacterium]|uniref:Uncharacterized protein n=1 Tax=Candidatus Sungiibacteriota bacterium TaxID=2750080 RepID=A0A931YDW4_9BACT|nr:hypothetical protein [Candidatus Sungbacteria bacterium]
MLFAILNTVPFTHNFSRKEAEMELVAKRVEEICQLVCEAISSAGKGSFSGMKFFGVIRPRRAGPLGPLGLRRQAWIGHLLEVTGISEVEINAFREGLSPEMKARITAAGQEYRAKMSAFWKSETARLTAETAQIKAERAAAAKEK